MRDVILVVPKDHSLADMQAVLSARFRTVINETEGRLTVLSEGDDFVEFVRDMSVEGYYDTDEAKALEPAGLTPQYYIVHFKDIELLKSVLSSVANRQDFVVDNDFGLIVRGNEFVERCKSTPGWDWIQSAQKGEKGTKH